MMARLKKNAKYWLRLVYHKEVPLEAVPDEHYQRVRVLLREAEKVKERLERILEK